MEQTDEHRIVDRHDDFLDQNCDSFSAQWEPAAAALFLVAGVALFALWSDSIDVDKRAASMEEAVMQQMMKQGQKS